MFIRLCVLLLTLLSLGSNLQASIWDNVSSPFSKNKPHVPSILVLLLHDSEGTDVEVRGKYSLFDPNQNSYLSTRFAGKRKYMQSMRDGLKWGEAFPGLYQLKISPEEAATTILIGDKAYSGPVYVYDIGERISIVNEVVIEDYVRSILSNSDLSSMHPEVVAALAIVARTNAYYQAMNPKTKFWAVDAQKVGYHGVSSETAQSRYAQEATRLTRHMIMSRTGVYEGIATPFLADFGFITAASAKGAAPSRISLEEANEMAQNGEHAAQILGKAFPGSTIMLSAQLPQ